MMERASSWARWLVAYTGLYLGELLVRVAIDKASLFSDQSGHFDDTILLVTHPRWSSLFVTNGYFTYYPPFVSFVATPFNLLFHFNTKATTFGVSAVFLLVLFFATFEIGAVLESEAVGFCSAVVLSLYPMIYGQAQWFMLDVPLTAMVALSVFLALRSPESYRAAVVNGVVYSLGFLTKITYPFFMIGPFLWRLWTFRRKPRELIVEFGIFFAVGLAFYLPRVHFLTSGWHDLASGDKAWGIPTYQAGASISTVLAFYPSTLWLNTSLILAGAFVIGLAGFGISRFREKAVLMGWILISAIVLSFLPNVEPRAYSPALPAIAIITACGLLSLTKRLPSTLRIGAGTAVALFCYVQLYAQAFGISWLPEGSGIGGVPFNDRPVLFTQHHNYVNGCRTTLPTTEEAFDYIVTELRREGDPHRKYVLVSRNVPVFVWSTLVYKEDIALYVDKRPPIEAIADLRTGIDPKDIKFILVYSENRDRDAKFFAAERLPYRAFPSVINGPPGVILALPYSQRTQQILLKAGWLPAKQV